MKKLQFSIITIVLFLFNACETQTQKKEVQKIETPAEELINKIEIHDLEILEIENCEYIFYKKSPNTNRGFGFMAHKGNCKNPIHYYSRSRKDH
ncbi:hypothetical protein MNBD_BACTEROID03-1014 [hydrothermal vent metagenome]|uniref:Uncharacterized protein n=1 Tax=hydrothermal vent metagenome TaxID=652676 RepID=A0A3B0TJ87_9ZZZZ